MENQRMVNSTQWPLWLATAAIVVFSMIFVMGTSTAYGVPVWAFMTSAADYVSAFVLNLPFVLVVVTCAFLATVGLVVIFVTVIYAAILLIGLIALVLVAPLVGATVRVPRWLQVTFVVLLYGALLYGLYLLGPIAWRWSSEQVANGSGFLSSAGTVTLNIIGALVGYSNLSIDYLVPETYARGKEWTWAMNGAFGLSYALLTVRFGLLSFEQRRRRAAEARAEVEEELYPAPDGERTVSGEARASFERGRRDYIGALQSLKTHLPMLAACLVPLVCVVTFGAGAVKGRLDRDQGVRVHVELKEGGTTEGLMVASLERGVLLCDARCDRDSGPLRLFAWDLIKRVDIMSAAAVTASPPSLQRTAEPPAAAPNEASAPATVSARAETAAAPPLETTPR